MLATSNSDAGRQFLTEDSRLLNMQAPRPGPDHRRLRLDADQFVPLLVEIGQSPAQCLQDVLHADPLVLPFVDHGVFQVEHHAGRAGVKHFDHQIGVVRRTRHLVALVLAPFRQLDSPVAAHRVPGKPVYRLFSLMRLCQDLLPLRDQRPLARRKAAMQGCQKLQKSLGQVVVRIKCRGRAIHLKTLQGKVARRELWP